MTIPVPPTKHSRKWVNYIVGFAVGVGLGLAPFLGKFKIPGFSALLETIPFVLHALVVPVSAFLMGVVALGVQFFKDPVENLGKLKRSFKWLLAVLVGCIVIFVVVHILTVTNVPVPGEDRTVGIVTGFGDRIESCPCDKNLSDVECFDDLTLEPDSEKRCWDGLSIKIASIILALLYLAMTSCFGIAIGQLLRKETQNQNRGRSNIPGNQV